MKPETRPESKPAPGASPEREQPLRLTDGITSRTVAQLLAALGLYSLGLGLVMVCGVVFYTGGSWHEDDIIYKLAHFCLDYFFLVIPLAWLAGALGIVAWFWRRTLGYIEAVALASERLAAPTEEAIRLPEGLRGVEDHLNLARENALRSALLAKEAEQRKNDLVVYLAHDLKTPLTSVIGYLSLLRDEPDLPAEARARYTGVALDKAERLEELINEFFEITRFNLSRIELVPRRVDLTRMLEQVTFEFEPVFRQKQLRCALELPPKMEALCDADKIGRVFDNLLRNAASYADPGSCITVRGRAEGGGFTLQFENPGPTIPPAQLGRIFEQFYRLDTSRASSTGGAGLGLAIARQLIEAHGGRITAESAGETVRFTVFLPAAPARAQEERLAAAQTPPGSPRPGSAPVLSPGSSPVSPPVLQQSPAPDPAARDADAS